MEKKELLIRRSRAISGDYTVNAELPVVGSPIRQEPT